MRQMAAHVYEWSRYQPDRRLDANGHFVQAAPGAAGALVDPVAFHPGDEAQVRELGGAAAVVLTRPERTAEAVRCRDAFGCPVLVPRSLAAPADLEGTEPFAPGASLPAGLQVVALPDGTSPESPARPGAMALYHAPSGTGIVGGAVVGEPAGALSLALASAAEGAAADAAEVVEAARAARSLRALLSSPVRRVLVAEGQAVLRDAERALQDLVYKHDPAACLLRPDELVWQAPRTKGSRFARRSAECSRLLGLTVLDFEVTAVPPGKQNTLLHRHDGTEEAFVVLEGEGELLTERGAFPVRAGDVLGFPPRYPVAHAIRNTGNRELRLLAFGAESGGVGLAEYPESNKQLQWTGPGRMRLFYLPANQHVDYWEGERLDD